jgi:hypothetical protein
LLAIVPQLAQKIYFSIRGLSLNSAQPPNRVEVAFSEALLRSGGLVLWPP